MATNSYVALLRGINVGGNNLISMQSLRKAFEDEGHLDVSTYIASGNVLFRSDLPRADLETSLEDMIERRIGLDLTILVRSRAQMRNIIRSAPEGFGQQPDKYHSDVIFLKSPLNSTQAMKVVALREGVDQVWPGNGVLYFARLSELRTKSLLSKIVGTKPYQKMSIRSWATTARPAEMLEAHTGN